MQKERAMKSKQLSSWGVFLAFSVASAAGACNGSSDQSTKPDLGDGGVSGSGDGDGDNSPNGDGDGDGDDNGTGGSVGDGDGDDSAPGGSPGDGDGDGDGSSGGGTPGDGDGDSMALGGASGEQLAGVGQPCDQQDAFGCSASNSKLGLVCGSDQTWQVRQTCDETSSCDFNPGPNQGLCRTPLPECGNGTEPICIENEVVACLDGGFSGETLDVCDESCEAGACVMVADACVEEGPGVDLSNCAEDECPGVPYSCFECSWAVDVSGTVDAIARIPAEAPCEIAECQRDYYSGVLSLDSLPNGPVRITVGPGWGLIPFDDGSDDRTQDQVQCEPVVEDCVILPPAAGDVQNLEYRGFLLIALSDDMVERNVKAELVAPGTTCD